MARVRLPKRPPTPSDSEESSENGESEDEELVLPVGAEAEVRSDDPGFVGSFYEVTVTGRHESSRGRSYTVIYSTLVDDDGSPLEETAAAADVRPRPPREGRSREFAVHEAVEALHNEGWWAGVVSAVPPPVAGAPRVYSVTFPTSRETMEFGVTALRPHRVFQAGRWVPAAEVEDGNPLFRVGAQVEVSQSAKNFGESWSPASVLKVIGARNFLVQYTHTGEDREMTTAIIDSQYIRPARTSTRMDYRYRVSPSCHVEVMHEGSWWPGVIWEVLASGIDNKYVVKLKSYETDMDDVECVDVLTVGITQLRPHFDWDGKKWVRRLTEEFVNGTNLISRKRPSSSSFSLHKEVGESTDKIGSYHGKKLKSADVVSEPTSPLLSVCIDNHEIVHKSSSYPEETMKQRNAEVALGSQFAPPSLSSMAEFAHLSDSSLDQSSHLKKSSSQKIITPTAPVPQSRQLQASMFGTFGQPRSFGIQSLDPQTPKEGTAAKGIEEGRNIVSMSENLANPKKGFDNVELGNNVTVGRVMISEINTADSVDLTTTPKDFGGSQHAVSQQGGGGSAMNDRFSESLAIQHLPFAKTSPLWPQIEAMEIFSEGSHRPHLDQYSQRGPELHEGMALGLTISFANLAESITRLDMDDDIEGLFEGKMQGLALLEANGFNVGALRSRLEALLRGKNRHHAELRDDGMKMLKEKIARKETNDRERGTHISVLAVALRHLGLYARLMRDMIRSAVSRKLSNAIEISSLKAEANELERSYASIGASR